VIAHFTIHTSAGTITGIGSGKLEGRPAELKGRVPTGVMR
jgi:hypothetical protein